MFSELSVFSIINCISFWDKGTGRLSHFAVQDGKDLFAEWISVHPDKKVWNKSLKSYIHIKYLSINETLGYAPLSYEATKAITEITELLSYSKVKVIRPAKKKEVHLMVGKQRTTNEFVMYSVTKKQR